MKINIENNDKLKNLDISATKTKAKLLFNEAHEAYDSKNYDKSIELLDKSKTLYSILLQIDPEKGNLGFYRDIIPKLDLKIATCNAEKNKEFFEKTNINNNNSNNGKNSNNNKLTLEKKTSENILMNNTYNNGKISSVQGQGGSGLTKMDSNSNSNNDFSSTYNKSNSNVDKLISNFLISVDYSKLEDYKRYGIEQIKLAIDKEFEFNWHLAYQYYSKAAENFSNIVKSIDDKDSTFSKTFYIEKTNECVKKAEEMFKKGQVKMVIS